MRKLRHRKVKLLVEGTQPVVVASGQLSPLFSGRGYPGGVRAASGSLAQSSVWILLLFGPGRPAHSGHQDGSCCSLQPCWFPVAQSPPQCLLGDIHIPATIKILFLTVPYILQFLPPALHSYTYISLVTLETAKLGKSHAFPLRTLEGCGGQSAGGPGRRCAGMGFVYGC